MGGSKDKDKDPPATIRIKRPFVQVDLFEDQSQSQTLLTLSCEEGRISVDPCPIVNACPKLKEWLQHENYWTEPSFIHFQGMTLNVLTWMVELIYKGQVVVKGPEMKRLYQFLTWMEMRSLDQVQFSKVEVEKDEEEEKENEDKGEVDNGQPKRRGVKRKRGTKSRNRNNARTRRSARNRRGETPEYVNNSQEITIDTGEGDKSNTDNGPDETKTDLGFGGEQCQQTKPKRGRPRKPGRRQRQRQRRGYQDQVMSQVNSPQREEDEGCSTQGMQDEGSSTQGEQDEGSSTQGSCTSDSAATQSSNSSNGQGSASASSGSGSNSNSTSIETPASTTSSRSTTTTSSNIPEDKDFPEYIRTKDNRLKKLDTSLKRTGYSAVYFSNDRRVYIGIHLNMALKMAAHNVPESERW